MSGFVDSFPNRLDILSLDTPDLAAVLLEFFHSIGAGRRRDVMRTSYVVGEHMVPPGERRQEVMLAVIEAWCWLIRQGFVVPRPLPDWNDQYDFSRLGLSMTNRQQVAELQRRLRCPKELLHHVLLEKAWPIFLRGEYDTAAFQAFKELEVAVRDVGQFTADQFGKELMRKAFKPTSECLATQMAPLTDSREPSEEQKSLQELFAGAYGRVRNPTAHRHGVLCDPVEAFELLVLASHLLRIVDQRKPKSPSS